MGKRKLENKLAKIANKYFRGGSYTGELAKPRPRRPEYLGTLREPIPKALRNEHVRGLQLLFVHYNIPPESKNRWIFLAYELAKDNVPFFHLSTSGRPRNAEKENTELMKQFGLLPRRGRGRPRNRNDIDLVNLVEQRKKILSKKLNRRVTDKEVLENLITAFAKRHSSSVTVALGRLSYLQKKLSAARKEVRNSRKSQKSP